MNDSRDMREGRQELGLFCYCKVLKLPMKWTWIRCKYALQTQPTKMSIEKSTTKTSKKRSTIGMLRKERK